MFLMKCHRCMPKVGYNTRTGVQTLRYSHLVNALRIELHDHKRYNFFYQACLDNKILVGHLFLHI